MNIDEKSMTYRIIALLIFLVFFLPAFVHAAQFKITRVYDGDTIKAEGCDIVIMVRIVGIDASETSSKKREPGQPYGQQAKEYLTGLILDKAVVIKGQDLDRKNRLLGAIYLDGKNINLEMVRAGLAQV